MSDSPPGSLIISLDCEGRWGLSDMLGPRERLITQESLEWAYRCLLDALDRHGLSATFAFVSLFAMPADAQWERIKELRQSPAHHQWTEAAYEDFSHGSTSGWTFHEALQWVRSREQHEVASHSYSHLPMRGAGDALAYELNGVSDWARGENLTISTYIYPRNQIESSDLLRHPLIGFRDEPPLSRGLGPYLYYVSPLGRSSPDPAPQAGVVAIPGGDMLQWRCSWRRILPRAIAVSRWRSTLRHAAKTGGCAHLWLHPHNLITGHKQLDLLDIHLSDAAAFVRDGQLVNRTQREYSKYVLGRGSGNQ